MKKMGAKRSFGLGMVAWCLILFFFCRSGWSDQELVFTPTYDNLVASSFVYPDVANTPYPDAENAVGVHWSGWWDIYGSWVILLLLTRLLFILIFHLLTEGQSKVPS